MNLQRPKTLYSNGSLLITGEYFVLTGAKALAVPLKSGQSMRVESDFNQDEIIRWETNEQGKPWFLAEFTCKDLKIKGSSEMQTAQGLQKLLKTIRRIKPEFPGKSKSYRITCDIDFNRNWGWGSSATLISNLACYARIDPFELNKMVSSGSGYDIAASLSPSPIFYQTTEGKHMINPTAFNPPFKNSIRFLWLGRKQSTSSSIDNYFRVIQKNKNLIPAITALTNSISAEESMEEFIRCIAEHEKILSSTLNLQRVKEKYFTDFEGEIKSLGAWGGDFAMVVSRLDDKSIMRYFTEKGLNTLFGFDEIVKN